MSDYHEDSGDGIEKAALFISVSPDEYYERKLSCEQLYKALTQLTEKQSRRICAHYFLGICQADIARNEGVSRNVVSKSIHRGLKTIREVLRDF